MGRHIENQAFDVVLVFDRRSCDKFVTASCQQQIEQNQRCPFVSVDKSMVIGDGFDQRASFLVDRPMIAAIGSVYGSVNAPPIVDSGSARRLLQRIFVSADRVSKGYPVVPSISRQGALALFCASLR